MHGTGILLGMHGADFGNILFMPVGCKFYFYFILFFIFYFIFFLFYFILFLFLFLFYFLYISKNE